MGLSPEEAGLVGCCQFVAIWRERHHLRQGEVIKQEEEYSFYSSSITTDERSIEQMALLIRDHWGACENGAHYRRDVSLGEDASKISESSSAQNMAILRNLVLGLFEMDETKPERQYVPGWRRKMTWGQAMGMLRKGG